jgi:hypothetical protein
MEITEIKSKKLDVDGETVIIEINEQISIRDSENGRLKFKISFELLNEINKIKTTFENLNKNINE